MVMLPESEMEKHDIWFNAKMIVNKYFISEVKMWVSCTEKEIRPTLNEVMHDKVYGVDSHDNIQMLVVNVQVKQEHAVVFLLPEL